MDIRFEIPPDLLTPVDARRTLRDSVRTKLLPVSQRLLAGLRDETAQEGADGLAEQYRLEVTETSSGVEVEFQSESDIWLFWEEDTDPHMPPAGEGSELDQWAEERGLNAFSVAMRIAEEGTEGHHVAARLMSEYEEDLYGAMGEGFGDWVGKLGSG
ncbi:MAG: hypothetical protein QOH93_1248 [Chloroflexia bacterium]|jgi:hypothetical protein|nr:hypothetical protein [Chloroflexia bacterium]